MRRLRVRTVFDGTVAGIIGAMAIALWYLIFDAAKGHPVSSLELLAATLFGSAGAAPTGVGGLVFHLLAPLVLHLCIFALIGVVAAIIFETAEAEETLFPTMMILVPILEMFSIMILMLIGPSARVSLPWWKFLIGDVMATSAMLMFFLGRHPTLARHLEGPWMGVAREGALAGIIGAIVVAVWFLVCDVATGEIFRTPAVLGAVIFQGIFNPAQVRVTLPLVLGYTALHFFVFALFGIAIAVLLLGTEYEPLFALAAIFLLAIFESFFVGALAVFDQAALTALGFWKILAGNVLAVIAMLGFFQSRHRRWLPRLRERWKAVQLRRG
jgi:hypothetical protein